MPYPVYKVIHITGIAMIFVSLGALAFQALMSGERLASHKKVVMITHGLGLTLALVGGFGLLARIGVTGAWPGWVWMKLGVWIIFGAMVLVINRTPKLAMAHWFSIIGLAAIATAVANFKPGL